MLLSIAKLFFSIYRSVVVGLGVIFGIGAFLSGAIAVIVGVWDFVVWLFKADWRTTDFQAPVVSAVVFVVCYFAFKVFNHALVASERIWDEQFKDVRYPLEELDALTGSPGRTGFSIVLFFAFSFGFAIWLFYQFS